MAGMVGGQWTMNRYETAGAEVVRRRAVSIVTHLICVVATPAAHRSVTSPVMKVEVFTLGVVAHHRVGTKDPETEVSQLLLPLHVLWGGLVAEWLVFWTQVQKGPGSNRSRDAVG